MYYFASVFLAYCVNVEIFYCRWYYYFFCKSQNGMGGVRENEIYDDASKTINE